VTELGDLLAATGDRAGAERQYALVRAEQQLLRANGVDTDLELALFDADRSRPAAALAAARKTYALRRGVFAEDALGWALHAAGRDAQALPHARAAQRLGTRSALLRYHLGAIEFAVGRGMAARRDLAAALAINPHFSPLHAPAARAMLRRLR
jgi:tetratricopeptide (TPR) repeat protein